MATESAKTNGSLPAHYLQRYNEDSFLFTSESVGEGHPGEWEVVASNNDMLF